MYNRHSKKPETSHTIKWKSIKPFIRNVELRHVPKLFSNSCPLKLDGEMFWNLVIEPTTSKGNLSDKILAKHFLPRASKTALRSLNDPWRSLSLLFYHNICRFWHAPTLLLYNYKNQRTVRKEKHLLAPSWSSFKIVINCFSPSNVVCLYQFSFTFLRLPVLILSGKVT